MSPPLNIVLVTPEIPQNTGAIGRLCVNLDASLHLIRPLSFSLDETHLKRAGLDYWPHVDLHVHDSWEAFLQACAPAAERLHFLSTHADRGLYDERFATGAWLVFGCETAGLAPVFHERYGDRMLRIPVPGAHHRSLNLANAVAIVAYEARRQVDGW